MKEETEFLLLRVKMAAKERENDTEINRVSYSLHPASVKLY